MTGCEACGRALYFTERQVWPQTFCRPCAGARGLTRIADAAVLAKLYGRASAMPAWWRWTTFLEHALRWYVIPDL